MLQWKLVTDRYLSNKVLQKCLTTTIIDKDTYQKAQEERKRRATALGRNNKQTQMRKLQIPTLFHMGEVAALYDNPVKPAEYLYSLIESESK